MPRVGEAATQQTKVAIAATFVRFASVAFRRVRLLPEWQCEAVRFGRLFGLCGCAAVRAA